MPLVDIELGITVPYPDNNYANVRPTIRFSGIDPDGDIEAQLKACAEVYMKAVPIVEERLMQEAANLTSMNFEGIGVAGAFAAFEKHTNDQVAFIIKEMTRQQKILKENGLEEKPEKKKKKGK